MEMKEAGQADVRAGGPFVLVCNDGMEILLPEEGPRSANMRQAIYKTSQLAAYDGKNSFYVQRIFVPAKPRLQ